MSDFVTIAGGRTLSGTIKISGAKNAALPLLIASLLTGEKCSYKNIPNLEDIHNLLYLLEQLGATHNHDISDLNITVPRLIANEASYSLVKSLRASFWVLAPLLARGSSARVAMPGGDLIGTRGVDIHLDALAKMGADITIKHGVVYATALGGLRPARIEFRLPSVGATHQVMMAASLIRGETRIIGAAREPEVVALADMLNQMGARIEGAGTSEVIINGVSELGGAAVDVIGDRIEAGTYVLAGLLCGDNLKVEGINPYFLSGFTELLDQMGATLTINQDSLTVSKSRHLRAVSAKTDYFPGLATDFQPQLVAALSLADGESVLEETIYDSRFGHIPELCRLGAEIIVDQRAIKISGVKSLSGAKVEAGDIRSAAALVLAGLVAEGETELYEPIHLRRGYENFAEKLNGVGARIGFMLSNPEDCLLVGC
ncbi:MAG TPA: UDP-N-acetylglucosamine 1-carboxyvinyltransferase [Oligoflexia bacterium]|nr:UDP-N-acetylglucosamine 1-carboxyvinyltransferase [Oligoflexia bacterium]HMP27366.1 UDP-N-acetylglucosamine 1-carboxyvinyltransferase [Oligoflexia bacterium]